MVNLGMIDKLGYGIHNIYLSQRNRFFPLPDYVLSEKDKVILQIYGHTIDENYSKLLIERKDLQLDRVVLLDKIQKNIEINDAAAKTLKNKKLIEGRKPNYYIAASIAEAINDKEAYIKNRAIDDEHYKKLIIEYINKWNEASRKEIENLLMNKLSDVLDDDSKKNKVMNLLQSLRRQNKIKISKGKKWKLS